jgi:hypothetical protein
MTHLEKSFDLGEQIHVNDLIIGQEYYVYSNWTGYVKTTIINIMKDIQPSFYYVECTSDDIFCVNYTDLKEHCISKFYKINQNHPQKAVG